MNQRKTTEAGELRMIKSLFDESAEQSEQNTAESERINDESKIVQTPAPQYVEVNEAEDLIGNSSGADDLLASDEISRLDESELESLIEKINSADELIDRRTDLPSKNFENLDVAEIENQPEINSNEKQINESNAEVGNVSFISDFPADSSNQSSLFGSLSEEAKNDSLSGVSTSNAEPQSLAETARQSGLAYAAAITLFASVVFMLIIGWFADLLFGTSPWGKVGGIALGSLIGFIQLFRITSQIFKNQK